MITIYALVALLNLTSSSLLGIFVYLRNPMHVINRTFGTFCFFIAVWSGAYFLWQISTNAEQALLWVKVLTGATIFVSISYFHFILALLNKLKTKLRYFLWGYPIFGLFLLANFTPFFVKGVSLKLNFNFWPEPGILFHPFLALWIFYMLFALVLLFTEHRKATGRLRNQIHFILLGTIVGYLGGVTNYFLWYDIPIPPIGSWAATFYLGIVAYAIIKQQLFDIRVVLTELLVGIMGVMLLINIFSSQSAFEYTWKSALFVGFLFSGYLLIRTVLNEIKYREKLEKAYDELRQLDKAKSKFMSIVSHQLRTPLTAIKGYVSMILEGTYGNLPPKIKEPIKNVYDSNQRLIKLVNGLLNLSRLEAGKIKMNFTIVSLESLAKDVVDELYMQAKEKKISLTVKQSKKPLPAIRADEEKIRNVILNLIDNAIRYTEKGSIVITIKKLQNKIQISIKDTGTGMTKEEIKELFKSFSRGGAGNAFWTEGTGLGLYVAKQFIDMHKWKIWAESPGKGKGSTFFIELSIKK